jgi:hypothetical protein
MLTVIVATVGSYSLYWFSGGPDFGAWYWYLTIVPLVILTVRGLKTLAQMVASGSRSPTYQGVRVTAAILLLSVMTVINYFPWRAIDKYHNFRYFLPDIPELALEYNFGKSLVLIQSNSEADYESAWIYNSLDPYADGPVYVWDKDLKTRIDLLKAYSERPVWVVEGPNTTQNGFKVVADPLSSAELTGAGSVEP